MKTKLTAIWNLIWSEYFVVFTQKEKGDKWTEISAQLDSKDHKEMADGIYEALSEPTKTTTGTTSKGTFRILN